MVLNGEWFMDGNRKKKILIAGVASPIAVSLAQVLLEKEYEVIGIYRNRIPALDLQNESLTLIQHDLKEPLKGEIYADVIIDFAAELRSEKVAQHIRGNINTTQNLLAYAEKIGAKQFIYMSSFAVYGKVSGVVNELSDRNNLDNYGITKYIGEKLVEESNILSKLIIRLPRVLGKNVELEYPWIPMVVGKMLKDIPINYFNPNRLYNNFVHFDEFNKFICKMIGTPRECCEVLGLGTCNAIPIIEILNIIKMGLNSKSQLNEVIPPVSESAYLIDISRAVLRGFEPEDAKITLEKFVNNVMVSLP